MQKAIFFAGLAVCAWIVLSARDGEGMNAIAAGESATLAEAGSRALPAGRAAKYAGDDALVLERGEAGQFHVTALVDGQDARFLVDTGADTVALTVDEAERLGFAIDREAFRPLTQTASGTGYGTIVSIGTLEVAGGEFHDIDAVVIDGLSVNLLGQSVLGQLGAVSLEGDRMVIRR